MMMVRRYRVPGYRVPDYRVRRYRDHGYPIPDNPVRVRPATTLLLAAVVVLSSLGLAACSGDDDPSPATPTGARASSAAGQPAATATATAAETAPPAALAVLASADGTAKETPLRLEVNELRVEGRVTRLTFTVRNLSPVVPGQSPDRWQIATFFNDGLNQKKGATPDDTFSVDGVYLLDSAGGRRYLAARNATQGCVCSGNLAGTLVSAGTGVVLTSVFAALPAGVESVDVVVPGFAPFTKLAVSR
jgi:hypothetical protein